MICAVHDVRGSGEHVWPRWYLELMDSLGSPTGGWSRRGRPIKNSRDEQIRFPMRIRVLLPVCTECNNELNRRFEQPAEKSVRELATSRWLGGHSAFEWKAVGLWWAKIGLMLGHPAARYSHRELDRYAVRFRQAPPDYKWMVDGSPTPTGLSVFVHHASLEHGTIGATLAVPEHVQMADGSLQVSHVLQIVTPDISVSVVSHPGMTVVHPLVERGEAWELLRGAPPSGDLASLPQYPYGHVVFRKGLRAHEGFQIDASETSRLMSFFAHEVEQVPGAYPGWQQAQGGVRGRRRRRHGSR